MTPLEQLKAEVAKLKSEGKDCGVLEQHIAKHEQLADTAATLLKEKQRIQREMRNALPLE